MVWPCIAEALAASSGRTAKHSAAPGIPAIYCCQMTRELAELALAAEGWLEVDWVEGVLCLLPMSMRA